MRVQSSKEFDFDDFEDLRDTEFVDNFTAKQIKQIKTSSRPNTNQKKIMLRQKRKRKEENILETLKG